MRNYLSSRSSPYINTLTRRDFLTRTLKAGGALGLAALTQVPPFARRALAEGSIGLSGRKLLFIFLRGANDALNSCIPILDSSYNSTNRPNLSFHRKVVWTTARRDHVTFQRVRPPLSPMPMPSGSATASTRCTRR